MRCGLGLPGRRDLSAGSLTGQGYRMGVACRISIRRRVRPCTSACMTGPWHPRSSAAEFPKPWPAGAPMKGDAPVAAGYA
jgi:hypothetical protein